MKLDWSAVTGGKNSSRIQRAARVVNGLTGEQQALVRLAECADEKTGVRYGNRAVRKGRAVKIGGGGRNAGDRWAYQVWLVWA